MKSLLLNLALSTMLAAASGFELTAQPTPRAGCSPDSFVQFEGALRRAQAAFQNGDPELLKALWSHADDVTLMGAYGGHERGWSLVGARLSRVSDMKTASKHHHDEVISRIVGSDVAIIVQLEHIENPGAQTDNLRVTHVARCEDSSWRVVHRHADPLRETKYPGR